MKKYFGEFYLFSDVLKQELRDPEFRKLWEELQEKKSNRKTRVESTPKINNTSFREPAASKLAAN